MIKVIGKRLLIPNKDRLIGFEGDNQTGRLYFSFRKEFFTDVFGSESDLSVSAKLQASGASKAVAYVLTPVADLSNAQESVYELEILSGMVQTVGEIKLQLIILKDMGKDENQSDIPDLEWNSETQSFYACDSLDFETYSGSTGSAQLDAFKEILSKIGAKATNAVESATAASESAASAKGYAEEAEKAAAETETNANAAAESANTAAEKASEAESAAGAAGKDAASAKASSEAAGGLAEKAAASAAAASAGSEAAEKAKGAAESAKEAAEAAKAAALNAANDAKNEAFAAKSLAQLAMDAAGAAKAGAKSASDNAAASLSHMNEAARYSEEAKAAAQKFDGQLSSKVDGHIENTDNPHGVTAKQVGAYTKTETNDQIVEAVTPLEKAVAGKLDKVSSFVRVYPGVYATDDTDGTPYLITATSDLSYIGTSSGYIPLYEAGGQLKTATPTSDDSAANKGYVDKKVSGAKVGDGNVYWGGPNLKDTISPIDAAMMPDLGANRFAFLPPDAITVEYSRDGGTTWIDYDLSDTDKVKMFSGLLPSNRPTVGHITSAGSENCTADCKLRITITTQPDKIVYAMIRKFVINISTGYTTGSNVTIERATFAEPDNFSIIQANVPISGWSGYNVINNFAVQFGGYARQSSQIQKIRLTFGITGVNESYPKSALQVLNIYGFGGNVWITPSNMAQTGQIYSYDETQNATFPNQVRTSAVPQVENDLTNKKYVDAKIAVLTNPYELIETITLTEQTALLTRDKWPNGDAYNFSKVRVEVDSNTIEAGGFTVYVRYENNPVPHTWAVMATTGKAYFATFTGCVENGMLTETVVNAVTKRENSGGLQQTGAHTQISAIRFVRLWTTGASANNVGTKIRIYGVRA